MKAQLEILDTGYVWNWLVSLNNFLEGLEWGAGLVFMFTIFVLLVNKSGAGKKKSNEKEVADPLQPAANWLNEAIVDVTPADIQQRLFVGYNRAQRLLDHARRIEGENHERQ